MVEPSAAPPVIMFIRHGEKPGESGPPHGVNEHGQHDAHSLSVQGWTRAGALAGLFAQAPHDSHPHIVPPTRVLATSPSAQARSRREVDTARPTADRMKVVLEHDHAHGGEKHLVNEVLGSADPTLIVWHHGSMPKLVGHFPVVNRQDIPAEWPEERFDLIWVLVREPVSDLQYRFTVVAQMLLGDDTSVVPAS